MLSRWSQLNVERSIVSYSVCPWFDMLLLTPSIHLSLGLPILHFPSGSHSTVFLGGLFPDIPSTCPNHRGSFSSVTSKMFFPTSMIAAMCHFGISFLNFLADLLQ
jgi:hypothetical protein